MAVIASQLIKRAIEIGQTQPPQGAGPEVFAAVMEILQDMLVEEDRPREVRRDLSRVLGRTATDDTRLFVGDFGRALDDILLYFSGRHEAASSS